MISIYNLYGINFCALKFRRGPVWRKRQREGGSANTRGEGSGAGSPTAHTRTTSGPPSVGASGSPQKCRLRSSGGRGSPGAGEESMGDRWVRGRQRVPGHACAGREWQSNSAVRRKRGPRVLWPPPLELFVPHPCSQFKPDTRYASSTLCENEKPMKILNVGRTIFFHPQLERKNAAANITLLLLTITVLSEASKHPTNPLH